MMTLTARSAACDKGACQGMSEGNDIGCGRCAVPTSMCVYGAHIIGTYFPLGVFRAGVQREFEEHGLRRRPRACFSS